MAHVPHRPIDPKAPLYTQFRIRKRHLGLTNQVLADLAGVEKITVARALGLEPDIMSFNLAMRLGQALGFDRDHIAIAYARDVAKDEEFAARTSGDSEDQARFHELRIQYETSLGWQHSPFAPRKTGRRLAIRAARLGQNRSIDWIARQLASRPSGSSRNHSRLIKLFEAGKISVNDDQLLAWLRPLLLDLAQLDGIAQAQSGAHPLATTVDWREFRGFTDGARSRIYCPEAPVFRFRLGSTPTLHGPLNIQIFETHQPRKVSKGPIRVLAEKQPGFEIGIVLKGHARLTLSDEPFPLETLDRTYDFEVGRDGVTHDAIYSEGINSMIYFPSFRSYHRVEFLSKECVVAAFNIRGNLNLGRHFRKS